MNLNEQDESNTSPSSVMFRSVPISHMHRFYLSGEIGDPEKYVPMFEQIRTAEENDIVMIFINSPGGRFDTTIQFLRVLQETSATTVAVVEGMCMSAATLIFLACKHKQISKYSQFMFHNYSTQWSGKGAQIFVGMNHMHSQWARIMREMYSEVLTNEEIAEILSDRDLWLDDEAMTQRLEKNTKDEIEKQVVRKPRASARATATKNAKKK